MEDFILKVKSLAGTCEFSTFLNQMLADKLILSLRDSHIQKRLLDEPLTASFAAICTSAVSMEMVRKDVEDIQHQSSNQVNWVSRHQDYRSHEKNGRAKKPPYRGLHSNIQSRRKQHNNFKREPVESSLELNYKCFECGKRGHLQRNCPEYARVNNRSNRHSTHRMNSTN